RDGAPLVRRERERDDTAGGRQHSRSRVPPSSGRGAGAAEHPGPGARPGARTPAARDGRRRARATPRRAAHVARRPSVFLLGSAELEYDAGKVSCGVNVTHVFVLKNAGGSDLSVDAKPG